MEVVSTGDNGEVGGGGGVIPRLRLSLSKRCESRVRSSLVVFLCVLLMSIPCFSGILKFYQEDLLQMDFIHLGQFLSKLPDDIPAASLFQAISSISLTEQKFTQTLAAQKEVAVQIKNVTSTTK